MSEPQDSNLELTRRAFVAFRPEAPEELIDLADPEVEFHISDGLGNSGTYHGHDEFLTATAEWTDAWEGLEMEILRMEPVGERHVVIEVNQSAKGRGSGVPVEMEIT